MQQNSTAALDLIIQWEGPEVNESPDEPGGISKYGVSLTTYADYCKKNNLPVPTMDTIRNMSEADARTFYTNVFFPAIRFNDLPSGVDVRLVDISINLGITGAVNALTLCMGPFTQTWPNLTTVTDQHITLINQVGPGHVVMALSGYWISNKQTKPSWTKYGHGWSKRNWDVTNQSLKLAGAQ